MNKITLDKRDYDAMVEWIIDARRLLNMYVLQDMPPAVEKWYKQQGWREELSHKIDCLRQNRVI